MVQKARLLNLAGGSVWPHPAVEGECLDDDHLLLFAR